MKTYKKMNIGEWSEPYTFIKLLADGKIYGADKNLNKREDIFYPLIKILTDEKTHLMEYSRDSSINIVNGTDNNKVAVLPVEEFSKMAITHLNEIKKHAKGKGSFECREIEDFLDSIGHVNLKSKSGDKRDITIVVHDMFTGANPKLGFSIKSKLGQPSTLFNSSQSTSFIYKLTLKKEIDKSPESVNDIEGTGKIIKRVQMLYEICSNIKFHDMNSEIFKCNLQIIDSSLPEIWAYMLLNCYNHNNSKLSNIITLVEKDNPLNYNLKINSDFYKYKIKRFLMDSALGMTATDSWKGQFDATGGYIIVKEDGELACYHIYNINDFQDYLVENTKLETPSTSRNNFGKVYMENGEYFFKLNLQVRFI